MYHKRTARLLQISTLLVAAAVALPPPIAAAPSGVESVRKCRKVIGRMNRRFARLGLEQIDRCHARQSALAPARDCNLLLLAREGTAGVSLFTALGTWNGRAGGSLTAYCPDADGLSVNYGGDDPAVTVDQVGDLVEASGAALQGPIPARATSGFEVVDRCRNTIGAARSDVVNHIVRAAVACQRRIDASAFAFSSLAPQCEPAAGAVERQAARRVASACEGLDGTAIGTCAPLPGCAVDAARKTGLDISRTIYGALCGNGSVDSGEACDDGNQDDLDGCTRACRGPDCGNEIVEAGEECDDGNLFDDDGCSECRLPFCGDGRFDETTEECDDGNATPGDGCTDCTIDAVECTGDRAWLSVLLDVRNTTLSGITLNIGYPSSAVSIPGTGRVRTVRDRLVRRTPLADFFFAIRDFSSAGTEVDDTIELVGVSTNSLDAGEESEFGLVEYDCIPGSALRPTDFPCRVIDAADEFANPIVGTSLEETLKCTLEVFATSPLVP